MKTSIIINALASITVLVCCFYLLFTHYADQKSKLEYSVNKYEYVLGKLALIIMAMGKLWLITSSPNLPKSQILLNIGLSLFMLWTCFRFDKLYYESRKQREQSKTVDPKGEEFPEEEG